MRNNYLFAEKTVVNVDNEFTVKGLTFVIPENNDNYKVLNRYDESDNYDNESHMVYITAVFGKDMKYYFYDENGDKVDGVKLKK